MSTKHRKAMIITSILLLFLGAVFIFLENVFYQYIDENGVLRESFFMPLGFLSIFIGLFFLLIIAIIKLMSRKNNMQ
ncbi:MAG: DUF3955 domain-containing protein [Endozoicomonadaceae bacterium]|nr:DUF3955 domain-containing protein [Endozoicomonadaceae bacterium]